MADYAGENRFPANVRIPNDGDFRNMTEFGAALEDVSDRTKYLQLKTPGANPSAVRLPVPLRNACALGTAQVNWSEELHVAGWPHYLVAGSPGGSNSVIALSLAGVLPASGRISGFGARIVGAAHSALPATRFSIELSITPHVGATWPPTISYAGDAVYDDAILDNYQSPRDVVAAIASPLTILNTAEYHIRAINEGGANSVAGMQLLTAWVEVVP